MGLIHNITWSDDARCEVSRCEMCSQSPLLWSLFPSTSGKLGLSTVQRLKGVRVHVFSNMPCGSFIHYFLPEDGRTTCRMGRCMTTTATRRMTSQKMTHFFYQLFQISSWLLKPNNIYLWGHAKYTQDIHSSQMIYQLLQPQTFWSLNSSSNRYFMLLWTATSSSSHRLPYPPPSIQVATIWQ